ncbi:MAG TPA: hypothetical protein VLA04_03765 [Verrucomicrobiae bacterium]|nr:hypothetical protein [Verrucomicrobiae bacterium]
MGSKIKEIATSQLQEAFAKALADLTGQPWSVAIGSIEYVQSQCQSFTGAETISFNAIATTEPAEEDENPFSKI